MSPGWQLSVLHKTSEVSRLRSFCMISFYHRSNAPELPFFYFIEYPEELASLLVKLPPSAGRGTSINADIVIWSALGHVDDDVPVEFWVCAYCRSLDGFHSLEVFVGFLDSSARRVGHAAGASALWGRGAQPEAVLVFLFPLWVLSAVIEQLVISVYTIEPIFVFW